MAGEWQIQLSGWILQDGNYPDLMQGQEAEFAIEYWWEEAPRSATSGDPLRQLVDRGVYKINGVVVSHADHVLVMDIGILVFREHESEGALAAGPCIAGEVGLGVDPFFYFGRLAADTRLPALVYSWRIQRIERNTTPRVLVGNVWTRDTSRVPWADVQATDAWHHEDAEYLLHCQLLDVPPKRESRTSTNWIAAHRIQDRT